MGATISPLADRFIEVVNGGDTGAFLAMFSGNGYVDDWGQAFVGTAAIERWSDAEFIGARGRMTDIRVTDDDGSVAVVAQWTSERHTGPSRFVLRPDGVLLASLTITAA